MRIAKVNAGMEPPTRDVIFQLVEVGYVKSAQIDFVLSCAEIQNAVTATVFVKDKCVIAPTAVEIVVACAAVDRVVA